MFIYRISGCLSWDHQVARLKLHPRPDMAGSPDSELKSSHLYILTLVFFLPSLNFGSFHFEVLFWIFLSTCFTVFVVSIFSFWPHLELRASWQFKFPCRPPLGLYSRVTTKVRAAPPSGGCSNILFVVCHCS